MPETAIGPALPAQELATDLIDQYHEHLMTARILWLFTTSKRTRGGHVVLGSSSRSNPLQRYLSSGRESVQTGADYIVLIDEGRWRRALATQRAALVDHLLCTMVEREVLNKRSGEVTKSWGVVGPDISEFSEVILRHGVWLPSQQQMAKAMREQGSTLRLSFPDLDADEPKSQPYLTESEPVRDVAEERETTVEPDGIVATTTRRGRGRPRKDRSIDEIPPARHLEDDRPVVEKELEDGPGGYAVPELDAEGYVIVPHDEPGVMDMEDTVIGVDDNAQPEEPNGADWRAEAGIGVTDLARHRAQRVGAGA